MARNIREKSKEGVGSIPEAIKEICFTWGREKTDFFQQQNDHLKSKGTFIVDFLCCDAYFLCTAVLAYDFCDIVLNEFDGSILWY